MSTTQSTQPFEIVSDISKNSVLITPSSNNHSIYAIQKEIGVIKYSSLRNAWINIEYNISNELPQNFLNDYKSSQLNTNYGHPAAIDLDTQTLYFLNMNGSMVILKLKDKDENKCDIKGQLIEYGIGAYGDATGIIINHQYHVIGGPNNNKHIVYNEKENKFKTLHEFDVPFYYHRVIKLQHKLLLFGGITNSSWGNDYELDTICEFDIALETWHILKIKMPRKMGGFGCTSIFNGKYIILMGGCCGDDWYDDIWIYCVGDKVFKKSIIKCPVKCGFEAFTVSDRVFDSFAVFGFIRRTWKDLSQSNVLAEIICGYYINEQIHLIDRYTNKHWKIGAFDII